MRMSNHAEVFLPHTHARVCKNTSALFDVTLWLQHLALFNVTWSHRTGTQTESILEALPYSINSFRGVLKFSYDIMCDQPQLDIVNCCLASMQCSWTLCVLSLLLCLGKAVQFVLLSWPPPHLGFIDTQSKERCHLEYTCAIRECYLSHAFHVFHSLPISCGENLRSAKFMTVFSLISSCYIYGSLIPRLSLALYSLYARTSLYAKIEGEGEPGTEPCPPLATWPWSRCHVLDCALCRSRAALYRENVANRDYTGGSVLNRGAKLPLKMAFAQAVAKVSMKKYKPKPFMTISVTC